MSAVSVVTDDRLWNGDTSDPIWDRFNPTEWRYELDTHLAEREEAEFTILTLVPAAEKPESPRAKRRRIMRDRLRGVRPKDEAELKTTRWYKRKKRARSGRRLRCTRTVLMHNQQGELEKRTKRQRIKPLPNLRHDAAPPIENDPVADDCVDGAITKDGHDQLEETEVTLEKSANAEAPTIVIHVPLDREVKDIDELDPDEVDPEISTLMIGDELLEEWPADALPDGFHPARAEHMPSRPLASHVTRRMLSVHTADEADDWGDHDVVYAGGEPLYLRAS